MPIHDMCIIAALAEGVNCQQIKIMQDGNKVWGVSGEAGDVFRPCPDLQMGAGAALRS